MAILVFALVFLVQIFNSLKKNSLRPPFALQQAILVCLAGWRIFRVVIDSRFFWESLTMVEFEPLPALGTASRSKQPAVVPADAKSMHVTSASAMVIHLLLPNCSWSFQRCKWSETTQTRLSKVSPSDAKSKIGHTVFIPLSAPQTLPHPLFVLQNQLKSQAAVSSAPPSQPATPWPRVVLSFYCSDSRKCPQFYLQATAWSPAIYAL